MDIHSIHRRFGGGGQSFNDALEVLKTDTKLDPNARRFLNGSKSPFTRFRHLNKFVEGPTYNRFRSVIFSIYHVEIFDVVVDTMQAIKDLHAEKRRGDDVGQKIKSGFKNLFQKDDVPDVALVLRLVSYFHYLLSSVPTKIQAGWRYDEICHFCGALIHEDHHFSVRKAAAKLLLCFVDLLASGNQLTHDKHRHVQAAGRQGSGRSDTGDVSDKTGSTSGDDDDDNADTFFYAPPRTTMTVPLAMLQELVLPGSTHKLVASYVQFLACIGTSTTSDVHSKSKMSISKSRSALRAATAAAKAKKEDVLAGVTSHSSPSSIRHYEFEGSAGGSPATATTLLPPLFYDTSRLRWRGGVQSLLSHSFLSRGISARERVRGGGDSGLPQRSTGAISDSDDSRLSDLDYMTSPRGSRGNSAGGVPGLVTHPQQHSRIAHDRNTSRFSRPLNAEETTAEAIKTSQKLGLISQVLQHVQDAMDAANASNGAGGSTASAFNSGRSGLAGDLSSPKGLDGGRDRGYENRFEAAAFYSGRRRGSSPDPPRRGRDIGRRASDPPVPMGRRGSGADRDTRPASEESGDMQHPCDIAGYGEWLAALQKHSGTDLGAFWIGVVVSHVLAPIFALPLENARGRRPGSSSGASSRQNSFRRSPRTSQTRNSPISGAAKSRQSSSAVTSPTASSPKCGTREKTLPAESRDRCHVRTTPPRRGTKDSPLASGAIKRPVTSGQIHFSGEGSPPHAHSAGSPVVRSASFLVTPMQPSPSVQKLLLRWLCTMMKNYRQFMPEVLSNCVNTLSMLHVFALALSTFPLQTLSTATTAVVVLELLFWRGQENIIESRINSRGTRGIPSAASSPASSTSSPKNGSPSSSGHRWSGVARGAKAGVQPERSSFGTWNADPQVVLQQWNWFTVEIYVQALSHSVSLQEGMLTAIEVARQRSLAHSPLSVSMPKLEKQWNGLQSFQAAVLAFLEAAVAGCNRSIAVATPRGSHGLGTSASTGNVKSAVKGMPGFQLPLQGWAYFVRACLQIAELLANCIDQLPLQQYGDSGSRNAGAAIAGGGLGVRSAHSATMGSVSPAGSRVYTPASGAHQSVEHVNAVAGGASASSATSTGARASGPTDSVDATYRANLGSSGSVGAPAGGNGSNGGTGTAGGFLGHAACIQGRLSPESMRVDFESATSHVTRLVVKLLSLPHAAIYSSVAGKIETEVLWQDTFSTMRRVRAVCSAPVFNQLVDDWELTMKEIASVVGSSVHASVEKVVRNAWNRNSDCCGSSEGEGKASFGEGSHRDNEDGQSTRGAHEGTAEDSPVSKYMDSFDEGEFRSHTRHLFDVAEPAIVWAAADGGVADNAWGDHDDVKDFGDRGMVVVVPSVSCNTRLFHMLLRFPMLGANETSVHEWARACPAIVHKKVMAAVNRLALFFVSAMSTTNGVIGQAISPSDQRRESRSWPFFSPTSVCYLMGEWLFDFVDQDVIPVVGYRDNAEGLRRVSSAASDLSNVDTAPANQRSAAYEGVTSDADFEESAVELKIFSIQALCKLFAAIETAVDDAEIVATDLAGRLVTAANELIDAEQDAANMPDPEVWGSSSDSSTTGSGSSSDEEDAVLEAMPRIGEKFEHGQAPTEKRTKPSVQATASIVREALQWQRSNCDAILLKHQDVSRVRDSLRARFRLLLRRLLLMDKYAFSPNLPRQALEVLEGASPTFFDGLSHRRDSSRNNSIDAGRRSSGGSMSASSSRQDMFNSAVPAIERHASGTTHTGLPPTSVLNSITDVNGVRSMRTGGVGPAVVAATGRVGAGVGVTRGAELRSTSKHAGQASTPAASEGVSGLQDDDFELDDTDFQHMVLQALFAAAIFHGFCEQGSALFQAYIQPLLPAFCICAENLHRLRMYCWFKIGSWKSDGPNSAVSQRKAKNIAIGSAGWEYGGNDQAKVCWNLFHRHIGSYGSRVALSRFLDVVAGSTALPIDASVQPWVAKQSQRSVTTLPLGLLRKQMAEIAKSLVREEIYLSNQDGWPLSVHLPWHQRGLRKPQAMQWRVASGTLLANCASALHTMVCSCTVAGPGDVATGHPMAPASTTLLDGGGSLFGGKVRQLPEVQRPCSDEVLDRAFLKSVGLPPLEQEQHLIQCVLSNDYLSLRFIQTLYIHEAEARAEQDDQRKRRMRLRKQQRRRRSTSPTDRVDIHSSKVRQKTIKHFMRRSRQSKAKKREAHRSRKVQSSSTTHSPLDPPPLGEEDERRGGRNRRWSSRDSSVDAPSTALSDSEEEERGAFAQILELDTPIVHEGNEEDMSQGSNATSDRSDGQSNLGQLRGRSGDDVEDHDFDQVDAREDDNELDNVGFDGDSGSFDTDTDQDDEETHTIDDESIEDADSAIPAPPEAPISLVRKAIDFWRIAHAYHSLMECCRHSSYLMHFGTELSGNDVFLPDFSLEEAYSHTGAGAMTAAKEAETKYHLQQQSRKSDLPDGSGPAQRGDHAHRTLPAADPDASMLSPMVRFALGTWHRCKRLLGGWASSSALEEAEWRISRISRLGSRSHARSMSFAASVPMDSPSAQQRSWESGLPNRDNAAGELSGGPNLSARGVNLRKQLQQEHGIHIKDLRLLFDRLRDEVERFLCRVGVNGKGLHSFVRDLRNEANAQALCQSVITFNAACCSSRNRPHVVRHFAGALRRLATRFSRPQLSRASGSRPKQEPGTHHSASSVSASNFQPAIDVDASLKPSLRSAIVARIGQQVLLHLTLISSAAAVGRGSDGSSASSSTGRVSSPRDEVLQAVLSLVACLHDWVFLQDDSVTLLVESYAFRRCMQRHASSHSAEFGDGPNLGTAQTSHRRSLSDWHLQEKRSDRMEDKHLTRSVDEDNMLTQVICEVLDGLLDHSWTDYAAIHMAGQTLMLELFNSYQRSQLQVFRASASTGPTANCPPRSFGVPSCTELPHQQRQFVFPPTGTIARAFRQECCATLARAATLQQSISFFDSTDHRLITLVSMDAEGTEDVAKRANSGRVDVWVRDLTGTHAWSFEVPSPRCIDSGSGSFQRDPTFCASGTLDAAPMSSKTPQPTGVRQNADTVVSSVHSRLGLLLESLMHHDSSAVSTNTTDASTTSSKPVDTFSRSEGDSVMFGQHILECMESIDDCFDQALDDERTMAVQMETQNYAGTGFKAMAESSEVWPKSFEPVTPVDAVRALLGDLGMLGAVISPQVQSESSGPYANNANTNQVSGQTARPATDAQYKQAFEFTPPANLVPIMAQVGSADIGDETIGPNGGVSSSGSAFVPGSFAADGKYVVGTSTDANSGTLKTQCTLHDSLAELDLCSPRRSVLNLACDVNISTDGTIHMKRCSSTMFGGLAGACLVGSVCTVHELIGAGLFENSWLASLKPNPPPQSPNIQRLGLRFCRTSTTDVLSVDLSCVVAQPLAQKLSPSAPFSTSPTHATDLPPPDVTVLQLWCSYGVNGEVPPVQAAVRQVLGSERVQCFAEANLTLHNWNYGKAQSGNNDFKFPCGLRIDRPQVVLVVCAATRGSLPCRPDPRDCTTFTIFVYTKVLRRSSHGLNRFEPHEKQTWQSGDRHQNQLNSAGSHPSDRSVECVEKVLERVAVGIGSVQRVVADILFNLEHTLRWYIETQNAARPVSFYHKSGRDGSTLSMGSISSESLSSGSSLAPVDDVDAGAGFDGSTSDSHRPGVPPASSAVCTLMPNQRLWCAGRFEKRHAFIKEIARVFRYRKPSGVVSMGSIIHGVQAEANGSAEQQKRRRAILGALRSRPQFFNHLFPERRDVAERQLPASSSTTDTSASMARSVQTGAVS